MGHTPDRNHNRNRTQGGNAHQPPKNQDEALMQDLKQREKSLNAVFISVRGPLSSSVATSLTTARLITRRLARSQPALCIASCTTFEMYRAYRSRFYTLQYTRTSPKGLPPPWLRSQLLSRRPRKARLITLISPLYSTSVRPASSG